MSEQPKRSKLAAKGLTLLVCVAVVGGAVYLTRTLDHAPRTDDAYVYADTVQVAPEVSGRIVEMAVRDNQNVRRGELLFRVDARPYEASLAKAEASLHALDEEIMLTQRTVNAQRLGAKGALAAVEKAKAAADQALDTLKRLEPLGGSDYLAAEQLDQARTARRSAQAQLQAAQLDAARAAAGVGGVDALVARREVIRAEIALARLNLDYASVRAPFDGTVLNLKTTAGQFAAAGHPVFTLLNTGRWWVVANFRETELEHIRAGEPASVYVLGTSSRRFEAVVESKGIGVFPDDGGGEVAGLPRVPRSINWVRVAQRFPVRMLVKDPDPELFRLGASAVAEMRPLAEAQSR